MQCERRSSHPWIEADAHRTEDARLAAEPLVGAIEEGVLLVDLGREALTGAEHDDAAAVAGRGCGHCRRTGAGRRFRNCEQGLTAIFKNQ